MADLYYIVESKLRNLRDHRIFSNAEDARKFASSTFKEAYEKYSALDDTVFSRRNYLLPKRWALLPLPKLQEGKWDTPFSFSYKVGEDGDDELSVHLDVTRWEMYLLVVYTDSYRESRDEISVKIIEAPLDVHDIEEEIEEEFE